MMDPPPGVESIHCTKLVLILGLALAGRLVDPLDCLVAALVDLTYSTQPHSTDAGVSKQLSICPMQGACRARIWGSARVT
jgi:hypothetical protein